MSNITASAPSLSSSTSGSLAAPITRAVIPAAGLGTRLRPLTNAIPKELLPVGRKPVLIHVVDELRAAGITHALFIVSEAKPQIKQLFGTLFVGDNDQSDLPPLQCDYVIQDQQRGLGDAISLSRDWTNGDHFVVAFGDCIIESVEALSPLRRLMRLHNQTRSSASTLLEKVAPERVSRYGIVKPLLADYMESLLGDGIELADIVEKPAVTDAPSDLAVAARWILSSEIFPFLESVEPDSRGEINLTDAVRNMKRAGGKIFGAALRRGEARCDIGNFGTYFQAFVRLALIDSEYGASVAEMLRRELD